MGYNLADTWEDMLQEKLRNGSLIMGKSSHIIRFEKKTKGEGGKIKI